jgi:ubiquinone biosynthesis accessory factor UbiJ
MSALHRLVPAALNHLLLAESWAQERLRSHADSHALIQAGPLDLHLLVDSDGLFQAGSAEHSPAVTISLPLDTPIRFLIDRKSVFQAAKLSGSADFAETLAFVFRNLRWDVEADLADYVGDIPARRLEMARYTLSRQGRDSFGRLFNNLAEYASEDSDWIVPRRELEAFGREVDVLRDDLARLEKRLARL